MHSTCCLFERLEDRRLLATTGIPVLPMKAEGRFIGPVRSLRQHAVEIDVGELPDSPREFIHGPNETLGREQPLGTLPKPGLASEGWSLVVPPGAYNVRIVAQAASPAGILAEGVTVIQTARSGVVADAATIWVDDGTLTLQPDAYTQLSDYRLLQVRVEPVHVDRSGYDFLRVEEALTRAADSALTLADTHQPGTFPRLLKPDGTWRTTNAGSWTAGFTSGLLWEVSQAEPAAVPFAQAFSEPMLDETVHPEDIYFRLTPSLQPRVDAGDASARQAIVEAADRKMQQFRTAAGVFNSDWWWLPPGTADSRADTLLVLDHNTDLLLLAEASRLTGEASYLQAAGRHLDKVLAEMIRPDGSTWHMIRLEAATGDVVSRETYQGYADDSTWARGQAWAMLTFAGMARETGRADYLAAARKVSDYFMSRLPKTSLPPWDFDDPNPNAPRDASAASVAAVALFELAALETGPAREARLAQAREVVLDLLSPDIFTGSRQGQGLLRFSAVNVPTGFGLSQPTMTGDYFFARAMNDFLATR